jgi:hypothetical protein
LSSAFPAFSRFAAYPRGRELEPAECAVVFHHFPKTAGSTFRRILESLFEPEEVCPAEIDAELPDPRKGGAPRLYAGHFSWDAGAAIPAAVRLILLRDPVQRVVSEFHNIACWRRYPEPWRRRIEARPVLHSFIDRLSNLSLEAYAAQRDPLVRDRLVNRQVRSLLSPPAGLDLWNGAERLAGVDPDDGEHFPLDDDGMLEQAKQRLRESFDFVGVQECFDLSLRLFAMTFGIRPFGDMQAFTVNRNPDTAEAAGYELAPDLRRRLEDLNRMDLELWRYGRQLLHERLHAVHGHYLREDRWLRRHPDQRHGIAAPAGDAPRRFHATIDRLPGRRGFHRLERDGHHRPFCWSGYEDPAVVEIELDLPDAATVEVRVEALAAIDDDARERLEVIFDGIALGGRSIALADDRLIYRGTVRVGRPAWPRRHHAVKFSGPRSLEPATVIHRRLLGVAVHALEVSVT